MPSGPVHRLSPNSISTLLFRVFVEGLAQRGHSFRSGIPARRSFMISNALIISLPTGCAANDSSFRRGRRRVFTTSQRRSRLGRTRKEFQRGGCDDASVPSRPRPANDASRRPVLFLPQSGSARSRFDHRAAPPSRPRHRSRALPFSRSSVPPCVCRQICPRCGQKPWRCGASSGNMGVGGFRRAACTSDRHHPRFGHQCTPSHQGTTARSLFMPLQRKDQRCGAVFRPPCPPTNSGAPGRTDHTNSRRRHWHGGSGCDLFEQCAGQR